MRSAVQLALAEKFHHSANKVEPDNALQGQEKRAGRDVAGLESHSGLRAPTPLPPGTRPEPLEEPLHWFIPGLEAPCPDDDGAPSMSLPGLADRAKWWTPPPTASALEVRRKEEEEQEKEKVMEELDVLMRIPFVQLTPDQRAVASRPGAFQAWKAWRRRKKKEKEEAPEDFFALLFWLRSSSTAAVTCSFCCFAGDVTFRAVFLSVVAWPEMLGIMAGMDKKGSPPVWCVHRRLWQWHVPGLFFFLAQCSLWLQTGPDARRHGRERTRRTRTPCIWQSLVPFGSCLRSTVRVDSGR